MFPRACPRCFGTAPGPHLARLAVWLLLTLLGVPSFPAAEPVAGATTAGRLPRPYPERLQWWADARFGIFVHWGPVSLKGTEISWSRANTNPKCPNQGAIPAAEYDQLYRAFNPTRFNAKEWIALARDAGAGYLVLTAKHCDGFLLWPSQASDYNIGHSPFGRDICGELAQAAHAQGFPLGWYFSPMDWRDPDFRTERNAAFLGRMQAELRELLTAYGPMGLLWFDWDAREPMYDQDRTYALVKQLRPRIIINNRLDLGPTNSDRQILSRHADYYTPEQHVGAYDDQRPWESCMTTSRKDQWAWGGTDDGVKTLAACLDMLVRCAGGDGNLLLNIGPMPTGEIAPEQATLLRQIGAWLAVHREAIRGTRGGPYLPGDYGAATRKGHTVYLHLREWWADTLRFPPLPARLVRARRLDGGAVEVRSTPDRGFDVTIPVSQRAPIVTVVALELDRPALSFPSVAVTEPASLTQGAKATASNVFQGEREYGPDRALDGRIDTRWATDAGTHAAWLELDLGEPKTFSRLRVRQAFPELKRIRRFAVETWQEGAWVPCAMAENPGASWTATIRPLTARRVRLNVTEATDGPTIQEFQLFP